MQVLALVQLAILYYAVVWPVLLFAAVAMLGLSLYFREKRRNGWYVVTGVATLALAALLWLTGCYIEWPQTHCPQFDPVTQQWVDRCAK